MLTNQIVSNKRKISKTKKRTSTLMDGQRKFVLSALIPIMILFAVFAATPIISSIMLSFYNYSPLDATSPFIGLENYYGLFKDGVFLKSLSNTIKFVFLSVLINIVVAIFIALCINSIEKRVFKDFFRTLYFLPTVTSIVGAALIWSTMMEPTHGLINMVLENIGFKGKIYWLADERFALFSVIAMTLWQDLGYNIVILMAGLDGIPRMFYEAAYIDGANRWEIFWNITLPLLMRTMLFVLVMTLISYFQVFEQVQVMTNGGPDYASQVIALSIYQNAFQFMRMGYASAMSVILFIIILIISILQIKFVKIDWEY